MSGHFSRRVAIVDNPLITTSTKPVADDDVLTVDKLNDAIRKMRKISGREPEYSPLPFVSRIAAEIDLYRVTYWPQKLVGHWIRPRRCQWFWRLLHRPIWIVTPMKIDQDPFWFQGGLYLSVRQHAAITDPLSC